MNRTILIDIKKIPDLLQQNYQFIDLRNPSDFAREHLTKFKNIPHDSFQIETAGIGKTMPVIFLCYTGAKSLALAKSLNEQGYNCYSINGGYYAIMSPVNDKYY